MSFIKQIVGDGHWLTQSLTLCSDELVAGPGFLERRFICIKIWGFRFADFISFFLNIP